MHIGIVAYIIQLLSGIIKESPEINYFLTSYFHLDTFQAVQASF